MRAIKFVICLCVSLLVGCATQKIVPIQPVSSARMGLNLAPATLHQTLDLQQHLTIEHPGRVDELDVALEIDAQHLNLVALKLGQRVMTINYDGHTLKVWRHPRLPVQVQAGDILENIELTLWPAVVIQQALPAGWRIQENGLQRTLLLNNVPIMLINYSNPQRWLGKIVLTNFRYHYRITIESINT